MAIEADHPTPFQMYGRYGLWILLAALDGRLDRPGFDALAADPACQQRWNLHFVTLADAVLLGRAGRHAEATASVDRAARAGQPYRMARWLGLRLICDAAIADGWGDPAAWLTGAQQYFHDAGIQPVARACRALLRRAGKPVNQRRRGHLDIPGPLRSAGVTPREYEVLRLVAQRHANRVIAGRLHISPRTVEKHVASLLMKTGQPDRTALGEYTESLKLE
jgi:DNA-binding CsgD family transcriptional regulator